MQENGRNLSIFYHLPCPAGVAKLVSKHGIIRKFHYVLMSKTTASPFGGRVKTPNIKILNSLCVHLWMRNEFFIFL